MKIRTKMMTKYHDNGNDADSHNDDKNGRYNESGKDTDGNDV